MTSIIFASGSRFFLGFVMGILAGIFVFFFIPLTIGIMTLGVVLILRRPEMFFITGLGFGFIMGIWSVFAYPNIFG